MTNQQMIESIRTLSTGRSLDPDLETDISNFLSRHGCDYLLTKIKNDSHRQHQALERAMNGIAIKERYKACTPLFSQSDIPYAVIKGAVLSQTMYQDPLIRASGDIDILIRRRDADHLKQLLTENGFVQGRITDAGIVPFSRRELLFQTALSHQTAPYVKATNNKLCPYINVDINMDILWGESDVKADMDLVLSYTESSSLFNISFHKLTPEMEFISLCLHHYKDLNSLYLLSNGSFKLGLFCEIYDYLRNVKPDATLISKFCERTNVGQYLYVCIHQTRQIFDDPLLNPYLKSLESDKNGSLLDSLGLNERERKSWGIDLFDRLLHPNLADYVQDKLSDEEKEKVKLNRLLM